MTWLHTNRRYWRIGFLLLLLLAIIGPWAFDLINVPSQYACSAPNIRLNDEFCGMPISVIGHFTIILFPMIGHIGSITADLFSGEVRFIEFLGTFFLPFLPLLPFLTIFPLVRGEDQRWQIMHLLVLSLVASFSLFLGLASLPRPYSAMQIWGLWLYITLTLGMLWIEIIVFRQNRRFTHE